MWKSGLSKNQIPRLLCMIQKPKIQFMPPIFPALPRGLQVFIFPHSVSFTIATHKHSALLVFFFQGPGSGKEISPYSVCKMC